jgi:hypothetical protein
MFTNSVAPKIFTEWLRPAIGVLLNLLGVTIAATIGIFFFTKSLRSSSDQVKHARVVEACADENEAKALVIKDGLCLRERCDDLEIMTRNAPHSLDGIGSNGRQDSR